MSTRSAPSLAPLPGEGDSELLSRLGDELMRMGRRAGNFTHGPHLEASAFKILWMLSDGRPRTLRELAADLGLDLSTINRQVSVAVRAGHLERFAVPGETSRPVRPTRQGGALYEQDLDARTDLLRSVLGQMDDGDVAALIRGLQAFNDAYDARADD